MPGKERLPRQLWSFSAGPARRDFGNLRIHELTSRPAGPSTATERSFRFPPGFLWGAATAAHQVEGDNRSNDWWPFEQAGKLPFKSGDACRHYELFERDFDLAQNMGHNAHRFSIEWSRIQPRQGEWDLAAIEHYRAVIEALRRRGIEPLVTLHHFTNPAWFADAGGWLVRRNIAHFARYAEFVAKHLGDQVRWWLTINEPTVYAKNAFVAGQWPPCRQGEWGAAWRAIRNMGRAHRLAYDILHRHRPDALVGFAHSAPLVMPRQPARPVDRSCALLRDLVLNRIPFLMMGGARRRRLDFIGLNYYCRTLVHWQPRGVAALFGRDWLEDDQGEPRRFSDIGWEIYPAGLTRHDQRRAVGEPDQRVGTMPVQDVVGEAMRPAHVAHGAPGGRPVALMAWRPVARHEGVLRVYRRLVDGNPPAHLLAELPGDELDVMGE